MAEKEGEAIYRTERLINSSNTKRERDDPRVDHLRKRKRGRERSLQKNRQQEEKGKAAGRIDGDRARIDKRDNLFVNGRGPHDPRM